MAEVNYQYIWRCAKCSNHFASILSLVGGLKLEKKCPKCKSLNTLTINNKEIFVHCRQVELADGSGNVDESDGQYLYREN